MAFGQQAYDRCCAQGISVAGLGRVGITADEFESIEEGVTELTIPLLLRRAAALDSGVQRAADTTSAPQGSCSAQPDPASRLVLRLVPARGGHRHTPPRVIWVESFNIRLIETFL